MNQTFNLEESSQGGDSFTPAYIPIRYKPIEEPKRDELIVNIKNSYNIKPVLKKTNGRLKPKQIQID